MHSLYRDPLALLSEEDLRAPPPPIVEKISRFDKFWYKRFRYDLYDWNDPEWKRKNHGCYAWKPIQLTQGYFMMVSLHDYEAMTTFADGSLKRWCTKIDSDKEGNIVGVYGKRNGRAGEAPTVYAHRELCGALEEPNVVVDHRNGWGLDNRRGTTERLVNLVATGQDANVHNAVRSRRKVENNALPTGVEPRGNQFGWIRVKRLGKKRIKTFRSPVRWNTAEEAGRAYLAELARLHEGRIVWAHRPTSVRFPKFPPRLKLDDVPF